MAKTKNEKNSYKEFQLKKGEASSLDDIWNVGMEPKKKKSEAKKPAMTKGTKGTKKNK